MRSILFNFNTNNFIDVLQTHCPGVRRRQHCGARNAVTVAPRDLEVIERNMVAFKGNKSPAAFITFGAVHESHIVEVETRT